MTMAANPLLTTTSLKASLGPPRSQPRRPASLNEHSSPFLLGATFRKHHHEDIAVEKAHGIKDDDEPAHSDYHVRHELNRPVRVLFEDFHLSRLVPSDLIPHPHLPPTLLSDRLVRIIGETLPMAWQNKCRDSGGFRSISDNAVTATIPLLAISNPKAAQRFLKLTQRRIKVEYGKESGSHTPVGDFMRFIDLFLPESKPEGLVFFIHGGAWGSGKPWFYRLVADTFLKRNLAVAIVGYRVYPFGDVTAQVSDLEQALYVLKERYPQLFQNSSTCLMGHSSGAHISMLLLLRLVEQGQQAIHAFDSFVGISGPYDISHHFDYEAARGVEELSPLKAANGMTRRAFRRNSPAHQARCMLMGDERHLAARLPRRMLLLHGIEDTTVPFTATSEAARLLRMCGVAQCEEAYVPETGHQDAVVSLMLGGKAHDTIIEWLEQSPKSNHVDAKLRSRL